MEPTTMMAISGAMKGVGFLIQGIAAKNQAKLDEFNIKTESVMAKAQGLREGRMLLEQFEDVYKSNIAFTLSKLNRKITPDLKAAFETDRDKVEDAVSDIDFMTYINALGYKQEAAATRRKGKEALFSGLLAMGQTGLETYQDYKDTERRTLLVKKLENAII
tara:strand:- start:1841 stop:2326 length:486 start_codon:yes stop_codon:yes gene_type:complete